jgi:formate/nitrite transporter FocA (FNT family)
MRADTMGKQDGNAGAKLGPTPVEDVREHEPTKPASSVLKQEIKQGTQETRRSATGLLLSGFSAGLELGFGVVAMGILLTLDGGTLHPVARELLVAAAYALGFVLVIIGDSELFTEHTTLAVFPVLNGNSSLRELLRLWGLVFAANLAGAAAIAWLLTRVGPGLGIIEPAVFGDVARQVTGHPAWVILLSGVLAGWLMGLLSWLVTAARETVSQILVIALITGTIGFAHLHHAVAGSIEVLAGVLSGQGVTWSAFGHFLLWATLGNIIGGVLLVALIKFGHAARTGHAPDEVTIKA